jgi:tetratricopeptide (TPR) repeat protein
MVCSLDEERSSVECEAEIWIRLLRDSVSSIAWTFPSNASIISIHDALENKLPRRQIASSRGDLFYDVTCPIPSDLGINDSVLFRIRYTLSADTSAAADVFLNEREFMFVSGRHSGWAPLLSDAEAPMMQLHAPVILEVLLSSQFTIISGGEVDSLYTRDGNTVWRIVRSDARGWEESFCLAGSKDARPRSSAEATGKCGVTLFTSPSKFHQPFAGAILRMLDAAATYYTSQQYRPRYQRLTFACIGTQSIGSRPVHSGNLVLLRNGPQYAVYDSSVFVSTLHNIWLQETARVYAFTVPDSLYWFNESWAGYLSTRFLFAHSDTSDHLQFRERSQILAHALDFFPTYPIAAGRTSHLNEDAVFLHKGRYVFLMLEYILGKETFDGVMRQVYERSTIASPSIAEMQALCESAYGSPLSWFFDEWLRRTGFPEYVLSSQTVPTPRGMYEVTVAVTQRGELFTMPLNIYFETGNRSYLKRVFVKDPQQRFMFIFPTLPTKIEWNPQYLVLRWIPQYRILAHARTSISFRVITHDLAASEREAQLALQLDPDNNVGANGIALFSLGKAAGARKDWTKAEEYFLRASQQRDPEWYAWFPLLSVVRHANILEVLGNREQAIVEYRRALEAAIRDPLSYWPVVIEAERFLAHPFVSTDEVWFENF